MIRTGCVTVLIAMLAVSVGGAELEPADRPSPAYDAAAMEKRLADFRRDLAAARDPVPVAARMAEDPVPACSIAGMDALVERWSDPRVEGFLEKLAAPEPRIVRDGLKTRAGEAHERLCIVRARNTLADALKGTRSVEERTTAIVRFLDQHPDLFKDNRAVEKFYLVRGLADELARDASPAAIEALVKLGFVDGDYVRQHADAVFAYAARLTEQQALSQPALVEAIADSADARALGLLERWLPHSLSDGQRSFIEASIRRLRESQGRG